MHPGSKWKVVADKVGESEGKGGLAALLLSINKGNNSPLPVSLPAIVGPASSSYSGQKQLATNGVRLGNVMQTYAGS